MKGFDIPQANSLARVRSVVEAVEQGRRTATDLQTATGLGPRHVDYHLQAARVLGWLAQDEGAWKGTPEGRALLGTPRGSSAERDLFAAAIRASKVVRRVAPRLLDVSSPTAEQIATRIQAQSDLSATTARRRAQALLAWRKQVGNQIAFDGFDEPPSVTALGTPRGLHLRSLLVERYGAVRQVGVRFHPFTVLIGRNATGKSTVMDSLVFVADALDHGPLWAVEQRARRLEDLLWFGEGDSFAFCFEFVIPEDLRSPSHTIARYELEVGRLTNGSVGVRTEALFLRPDENHEPWVGHGKTPRGWQRVLSLSSNGVAWYHSERTDWKTVFNLGSQKLALSALPEDLKRFPVTRRIKGLFRTGVQRLALHAESMKAACSPMLGSAFLPDGSNIPLVVQQLERRDGGVHADWVEHLKEALPDVETVRVIEREEDRHLYLKLTYTGGLELPAWRLSEGTLRILALTLIPFASESDAIYLVEEPENGIHPQAVEAVHQTLAHPFRVQIVVATHSPVFVGIVEPEQLLCFRREEGSTQVTGGADHPALKSWRRDVDLGTLFAARVLE